MPGWIIIIIIIDRSASPTRLYSGSTETINKTWQPLIPPSLPPIPPAALAAVVVLVVSPRTSQPSQSQSQSQATRQTLHFSEEEKVGSPEKPPCFALWTPTPMRNEEDDGLGPIVTSLSLSELMD